MSSLNEYLALTIMEERRREAMALRHSLPRSARTRRRFRYQPARQIP